MKIEIRHVRNGAVLRIEPEQTGDEAEEFVYQESESAGIDAFVDFLQLLLDHYGPTASRYSPKRIHIIIGPGDKYEPSSNQDSPDG